MKGLSLHQPWATLIAIGAKHIETRSWHTNYRGPVAIHASKAFPQDDRFLCHSQPFRRALIRGGYGYSFCDQAMVNTRSLPLGAIVAVANLVAMKSTSDTIWRANLSEDEHFFGDYSPGRFGWILADVRRLREPIPCRGMQGLWNVPADVEAKIREQLAETT